MKSEWILDARMIQFKWAWSPDDETIHCLLLMGYDAEKKHYTDWYFDSTGAVPEGESRRMWDERAKTLAGWSRSPNGRTTTQAHRFIGDDTFEWNMVIKDRNSKVMADMVGTAKRKALATSSDTQSQGGKAPLPEMKALERLVGTWDHEQIVKVPKETRSTNLVVKGELVLGGRFLQEQAGSDGKVNYHMEGKAVRQK